jgi:hypothetical protein
MFEDRDDKIVPTNVSAEVTYEWVNQKICLLTTSGKN